MFIHSNGDTRKIARCKVKPCELRERETGKKEENTEDNRDEDNRRIEKDEKVEDIGEKMEDEKEMKEDGLKDVIGAKYLKMAKSVCFLENSIYVVEVLVREHGKPEVIEAKGKDIKNLETYEAFEEIDDEGQETIGSRWIVTEKESMMGRSKIIGQD